MTANKGEHMQEQNDPTMEPTSEYTMRHAANFLAAMARNSGLRLAEDDIKTIDFAYQQLLRGANTLRSATEAAWDEGFSACATEHMRQRQDPDYPITRTNPYGAL